MIQFILGIIIGLNLGVLLCIMLDGCLRGKK